MRFFRKKESSQIIDRIELKAFTEHTVTDKLELKKEIAQFRNQGYAVDNQEIEQGLWCMAVPIYDNTGHNESCDQCIWSETANGRKKRTFKN